MFIFNFRAHMGVIEDMAVNHNGTLLCTISNDKNAKVFDIVNFDMINMLKLGYAPKLCEFIHRSGDAVSAMAITEGEKIRIYDAKADPNSPPLHVLEKMHMKPVTSIRYNAEFDVVISADEGGMIEYWAGLKGDYEHPKNVMFE